MAEQRLWQAVLSREQWIVAAIMALAIGLAWVSLFSMGMPAARSDMAPMPGMQVPYLSESWTASYAAMAFVMWTIMMVAMMLPSATPMILLYARVAGQASESSALPPTLLFAATYLVLWTVFALLATLAQWTLSHFQLLSDSTMAIGNNRIGGALLIAAGAYQLTGLKRVCLDNCRSPFFFLTAHWRPGVLGPLKLGLRHGVYCIGCCWLLMALLFFGGVMNLTWVAAIGAVVLAEKVARLGPFLGQIVGGMAILAGTALVIAPNANIAVTTGSGIEPVHKRVAASTQSPPNWRMQ